MGNWYEERLYPPQPFREERSKAVTLYSHSLVVKIKASPLSMEPDSKELFLVLNVGRSGRLSTVSFSMMALYNLFYAETWCDRTKSWISRLWTTVFL